MTAEQQIPGTRHSGDGHLRASDADRERVIDVLRAGFVEGRLSQDEHETRTSQALAARTYADLRSLTADLPGPAPAPWRADAPVGPEPGADGQDRNTLARWSLFLALFAPVGGLLAAVPAIFFGCAAQRQIRRTGERGLAMARAGVTIGWVMVLAFVAITIADLAH